MDISSKLSAPSSYVPNLGTLARGPALLSCILSQQLRASRQNFLERLILSQQPQKSKFLESVQILRKHSGATTRTIHDACQSSRASSEAQEI